MRPPYGHTRAETNWALLDEPLERAGFRLRPRYRTGWVRSWVRTKKKPKSCEDKRCHHNGCPSASRSDGAQVLLKMLHDDDRDGPELQALEYFSDRSRAHDPCNHCLPLLDCFSFPSARNSMVEPLLRDWIYPPFLMVAEASCTSGDRGTPSSSYCSGATLAYELPTF
ncbi:hypothetical protein CALCODRAFT_428456 [Calocera cornea HHB12733]|uniref:Uncharacterized protein n=1 Tax=Calocera cornea HHB12733 TaxID=1353952 RepID=A0A165IUQ7_9BASI|nr:hypothetical protein CALCODRAFT_428456 [Calocera cornea HHB12733]